MRDIGFCVKDVCKWVHKKNREKDNPIQLKDVPKEPSIIIFNPDGSELITTNDYTTFLYIRTQIKEKKLEGYTIQTSNGVTCEIKSNGKLDVWPDGYIPGDIAGKLVTNLL